jgi:hypothetical protein
MKDMDLGLGFRKDRVLEEMQGRVWREVVTRNTLWL